MRKKTGILDEESYSKDTEEDDNSNTNDDDDEKYTRVSSALYERVMQEGTERNRKKSYSMRCYVSTFISTYFPKCLSVLFMYSH